jgi:hypothetical protein
MSEALTDDAHNDAENEVVSPGSKCADKAGPAAVDMVSREGDEAPDCVEGSIPEAGESGERGATPEGRGQDIGISGGIGIQGGGVVQGVPGSRGVTAGIGVVLESRGVIPEGREAAAGGRGATDVTGAIGTADMGLVGRVSKELADTVTGLLVVGMGKTDR